jgi:penicillin amidase
MLNNFVKTYYDKDTILAYWATWDPRSRVLHDISRRPPDALAAPLRHAMLHSQRAFKRFGTWGGMHRLRLGHPFSAVPFIGKRYVFSDTAASGGGDSVNKTGHRFTAGSHQVTYGSSARHISDLSDLDCNYFVLLGGQDGWLGSDTYGDQLALWHRNETVQVPLRPSTARARSSHRIELKTAPARSRRP